MRKTWRSLDSDKVVSVEMRGFTEEDVILFSVLFESVRVLVLKAAGVREGFVLEEDYDE